MPCGIPGQPVGAFGDCRGDRWRTLRRWRVLLVAILLVSCVIALPVATANLPDAPWIDGAYDAYDSLVVLFSSLHCSGEPLLVLPRPLLVARRLAPIDSVFRSSRVDKALQTRSPPFF